MGGLRPKLSVEKATSFRVHVGEIKAKHRGNWLGINVMSSGEELGQNEECTLCRHGMVNYVSGLREARSSSFSKRQLWVSV